jgi:hypothetical protein
MKVNLLLHIGSEMWLLSGSKHVARKCMNVQYVNPCQQSRGKNLVPSFVQQSGKEVCC